MTPQRLVLWADIGGTALFAIEGATAAMRGGLDLLGIAVLAFTTALGGGVTRDVLLGAGPPQALKDWRYPALAIGAGLAAFLLYGLVVDIPANLLLTLDAAGLALFAVAGAEKALDHKLHPFIAMLLGTITACGGGMIRDVLLTRVPAILRVDIYATAALAGAAILVGARRLGLSPGASALLGGLICFALRLAAVHWGWQLPSIGAAN